MIRVCLKCRDQFMSHGDRLCGPCNARNKAVSRMLALSPPDPRIPKRHRNKLDNPNLEVNQ